MQQDSTSNGGTGNQISIGVIGQSTIAVTTIITIITTTVHHHLPFFMDAVPSTTTLRLKVATTTVMT